MNQMHTSSMQHAKYAGRVSGPEIASLRLPSSTWLHPCPFSALSHSGDPHAPHPPPPPMKKTLPSETIEYHTTKRTMECPKMSSLR